MNHGLIVVAERKRHKVRAVPQTSLYLVIRASAFPHDLLWRQCAKVGVRNGMTLYADVSQLAFFNLVPRKNVELMVADRPSGALAYRACREEQVRGYAIGTEDWQGMLMNGLHAIVKSKCDAVFHMQQLAERHNGGA